MNCPRCSNHNPAAPAQLCLGHELSALGEEIATLRSRLAAAEEALLALHTNVGRMMRYQPMGHREPRVGCVCRWCGIHRAMYAATAALAGGEEKG